MRVLAYAAVSMCIASPLLAAPITVSPAVSVSFDGEIGPDYDGEASNCGVIREGPVLMLDQPTGQGTIGNMEAYFFADDRRANFEFNVAGLTKIKKATLKFDAFDVEGGSDGAINCLMHYQGDGLASLGDYMPTGKSWFADFETEWLSYWPSELIGYYGALDITALLRSVVKARHDFLGIQFATDNYADSVIDLYGVRIEVVVPEPVALTLFGLGLAGLALVRRRT